MPFTGSATGSVFLITITADSIDPINDTTQLYVNGAFVSEQVGASINAFNVSSLPFKFGFNTNTDATYWRGNTKSLLLYNKVLSLSEIQQNYNTLVSASSF
jgi:hypothetical protein